MENTHKDQRNANDRSNQDQKRPVENPSKGSEKNFGSEKSGASTSTKTGQEGRDDAQRSGSSRQ